MIVSSLGDVGVPCDAAVLAPSSVNQWVSIRSAWGGLQPLEPTGGPTNNPTDPSYDWSYLDSEIGRVTTAGKGILLRVLVQNGAPGWLFQLPGMQSYTDSQGQTLWVWWDPVVNPYLQAMYQAVGARYGANNSLKVIAIEIAVTHSGDWGIPNGTSTWNISANVTCPAYGATVTVVPQPNQPVFAGSIGYITGFGFFQATDVNGPQSHPTSVQLTNLGTAGNASSGTILAGSLVTVSDINNLVSRIYLYTSTRIINTVQATIDTIAGAFPNAIMTLAVGRNGNLDPTSGGILPTATQVNPNYVCEHITRANITKYGPRFAIQKNQLTSTIAPPAQALLTNSNFTILAEFQGRVIIGMQESLVAFGNTSWHDSGGVPDPLGYADVLKKIMVLAQEYLSNQPYPTVTPGWFEIYQGDVINLSSVILPYVAQPLVANVAGYPALLTRGVTEGAHFFEVYDPFINADPSGGPLFQVNQELVALGVASTEPAAQPQLNLNEMTPFTISVSDPYPWSEVTVQEIVPLSAAVL
jgi:hypothetical protein